MNKRGRALKEELEEFVQKVVPTLKEERADKADLVKIVNIVSTVNILPQTNGAGPKLPLEALTREFLCSYYAPSSFAANMVQVNDIFRYCTGLMFASGSIVLVSTLTPIHTIWIGQSLARLIEKVDNGALAGRTVYENAHVHNIVGHGDLGCKIDLQAMANAAPLACRFDEKAFPGLKFKMWLNEEQTCQCKRSAKQRKIDDVEKVVGKVGRCTCVVKVLVFKTGEVVVTGAKSQEDVQNVFLWMKQYVPSQYELDASNFYKAMSQIMVKGKGIVHRRELKPDEVLACVLANVDFFVPEQQIVQKKHTGTPFMRLCEAGRVEEVKMMLLMDPECKNARDSNGKTAYERLMGMADRTPENKIILDLLRGDGEFKAGL